MGLGVDHGYTRADRREDRRVLAADHATAEDEQRPRGPLDAEDVLDIVHVRVVQRHTGQVVRARTRGEEYHLGLEHGPLAAGPLDLDAPAGKESRPPADLLDAVTHQVALDGFGHEL